MSERSAAIDLLASGSHGGFTVDDRDAVLATHRRACRNHPSETEHFDAARDVLLAECVPQLDLLTEEERREVEATREDRCWCHEAYTSRGMVDPQCQHEAIDGLLAVIDRVAPPPPATPLPETDRSNEK